MCKTSALIGFLADQAELQVSMALKRLAEIVHQHHEQITIAAQQTVQDIDPDDILVGRNALRLRGVLIPCEGFRITSRVHPDGVPSAEDVMAGDACIFSYGANEPRFLTVASREIGSRMKMRYAEEAIDVVATSAINTGARLLISKDGDPDAEVIDPADITVNEEGIHLGAVTPVAWSEITALTVQDTLSLAIGRSSMVTISQG